MRGQGRRFARDQDDHGTRGPAVTWLGGSGEHPRPRHARTEPPQEDSVRWIAGSTGRAPASRHARQDFPRSSLAAWEAVVTRGRPAKKPPDEQPDSEGVEANARLTGMTAAVLLVLFVIEGITILRVRSLLTVHVVIGMLLLPPVLLKIGSTGWRFGRYYLGSPEYRRKGPPPALLRLLGPFVVVLTLAVIGTGIALLVGPASMRNTFFALHRDTFILWFIAMAMHVLGHVLEMTRLAPADFYHRTRRQVRGAGARQWVIVTSLGIGLLLAVILAPKAATWLTETSAHPAPKPTATTLAPGTTTTVVNPAG